MPLPTEMREEIIAAVRRRLLDAVAEGHDVVVDLSFWSRAMRDEWRALLAPTDAKVDILHVVADRATALARLRERAGAHADDFALPPGRSQVGAFFVVSGFQLARGWSHTAAMPLIHVMNASPSDRDRKRELIARLTETYAEVMQMRPDTIRVIIDEHPRDSWGVGGVTLEDSGQNESLPS